MKPLLVTSGEPAGIGLDLCLALMGHECPMVVIADKTVLAQRAQKLGRQIEIHDYSPEEPVISRQNHLTVIHVPCVSGVVPGQLDSSNSAYVMEMLSRATDLCLQGCFSALITAPIHKGILNDAGYPLTGHTEFFAERCGCHTVVMMLASSMMRVALITTHLPLREVADTVKRPLIIDVIRCLNAALQKDFAIKKPRIWVAGLNPHAGESGHLGREEIEEIKPALAELSEEGINVHGPFSADTMFSPKNIESCDVFVAMYHDQGLPVLKYVGFGNAVNITLGLPIIRTSVDHGTALELAGTGRAQTSSLLSAVSMAEQMARARDDAHGC